MTQLTARNETPRSIRMHLVAAALVAAVAWTSPAAAQCTLAGSITQFEPNPPGATRPDSLKPFLSISGFFPFSWGGNPHLLVTENFGYQVVDITSRAQPVALGFEDYRISPSFPGPIPCNGDCHSTMGTMNVSADGQRAIFGMNSLQSSPYHTVVGQVAVNGWQYTLAGDMAPVGPGGVLVQVLPPATYVAYTFASDGVRVADVTALPGLQVDNLQWRLAGNLPANGYQPSVTGTWLTYTDGANVYLVNVSNPFPASSLTAQQFSASSFGRPNDILATYSAIKDPSDDAAVYILGEFRTGSSHGGWTVIRVKSGQPTVVGTLRPAGGETNTSSVSLGADNTGGLFAVMWTRVSATSAYRLYSSPIATFGGTSGFFDVTTSGFNAGRPTLVAGTNAAEIFGYVPAGSSGWVVPMRCISQNAPATPSLAVTNASAGGAAVSSGDTVFFGDQLTIVPTVNPSPQAQPLTGFLYNFDFDFHTGNATEDAGSGVSPRIKISDAGAWGQGQPLPPQITLVGPCDFAAGGTPGSGSGCWNSVKTNSNFGGPDFTGAETAGTVKPLSFALEANNQYGSAGAAIFTVNWKVPAAKLASTQVLSGQPLVSASDGHPMAAGFKWYFGDAPPLTPAACTGPTCVPTGAAALKGTHSYWVTATYANGYQTPDYVSGTGMGTYTITDFAPAFTVNASTVSASAIINSNLALLNSSQRGAVTSSGYFYSLCKIPCADNYVSWGAMGDPPANGTPASSATIPVPGVVGSYALKIKINYTGGTAFWPDPTGTLAFPVTVIQSFPEIWFHDSCGFGCSDHGSISANTGTVLKPWAYNNGIPDTVTQGLSWVAPGGTPSSGTGFQFSVSYPAAGTYTLTLNGYGSPVTAQITITGPAPTPLSITSATASPGIVAPNTAVSFACGATGGTGSYSYSWTFSDGGSATGAFTTHAFTNTGFFTGTCTVNDGQNQASQQTSAVNVTSGSSGAQQIWFKDSCGFGCSDKGSITIGTGTSMAAWAYVNGIPDTVTQGLSWSAPGGTPASGSGRIFSYKYDNPGTYTLTLNGYGSPVTASVTVTGAPTGGGCTAFDFDVQHPAGTSVRTPSAPGAGGGGTTFTASVGWNLIFTQSTGTAPTSWLWDFNDGTTATTQTPQHVYGRTGIFTVSLTIPSVNGTASCTKTNTITIAGPSGDFTPQYNGDNTPFVPTNVAPNKSVLFTAADAPSAVDTYVWDFGDGSAHAQGKTAVHAFSPGSWTVTLTVTSGTASVSTSLAISVADEPKWVVPGMAYITGSNDTLWQSDVTISNPDRVNPANYAVAFLDALNPVDDGSRLTWFPITVPPLGSAHSGNVLKEVFGQSLGSYGALMVRGDLGALAPIITARTFNNGDISKGTFGLSVPAAAVSSGGITAQAAPAASILIGLRQNDKAYTNLGLVNMSNESPKVRLEFLDEATGALLIEKTVDLRPYQSLQLNRALEGAGHLDPVNLFAVRVSIVPQGPVARPYSVYPYATVIDSGSTDPIVVTPSAAPATAYRIPGIVRLTGAHGERWRSRVTITNPSSASRKITMTFSYIPCRNGTCFSRLTVPLDVRMAAGQTQSWDDLVNVWLTYGAGTPADDATSYQSSFLDVQPAIGDTNPDPLVVLGETYNDTTRGHVGLQIPGYVASDGARTAGANKRLVLAGLSATTSYRTNVALFAVGGANGKWCSLKRYGPNGDKLGDDLALFIDGFAQIDVAAGLSPDLDLSRITAVVDSIDDGISVAGYATIIDNTSGDSTFVKAQPTP